MWQASAFRLGFGGFVGLSTLLPLSSTEILAQLFGSRGRDDSAWWSLPHLRSHITPDHGYARKTRVRGAGLALRAPRAFCCSSSFSVASDFWLVVGGFQLQRVVGLVPRLYRVSDGADAGTAQALREVLDWRFGSSCRRIWGSQVSGWRRPEGLAGLAGMARGEFFYFISSTDFPSLAGLP